MKRVFLSFLFVALSAMTFAQQWTGISQDSPVGPNIKLVSSSEKQIVVDFTLGGFSLARVSTPNGMQQIVSVPKMVSMLEAGAPDLPQFPIPAIIGDKAEMTVRVTRCSFTDYTDIEIAPSKGNFSRQIDPATVPYTYGAMYSQNAFYPAEQAHLEAPYIIRDFRGQNIMVTPFAYNPVTKTLRVYHKMTIEMSKVSDHGANPKLARKADRKILSEMHSDYSHRFINYEESASKYTFIHDCGEMLVICPEQYMEAMQPFVEWKNQSGRLTTMVSLAEAGGNHDTQIKNYIKNIYEDPQHNLRYVLLVGDYSDLKPHSMNNGRSDNWFGQLEGNDYYIEVLVGRFSVESVADVQTHVEKVIHYERDINESDTWLDHGIGIGANEGNGNGHNGGEADYVHMDYIRDTLLHYTYKTVSQQYSGLSSMGTSAYAISADVNNGASIINYCNHGSQDSWAVANYSNSHVNALVNDDKWPFIWSVACLNGEFSGNCFAEAWLRATNNETGRPTGAVGGMFSWISQPWVPPMTGQDEMVNIVTEWKHSDEFCHTLGGVSLNGNMYILDMHPGNDGERTHNTWLLFGDPSLMVRTDVPVSMNVSCNPSLLMLNATELEVYAENTAFGIATLTMDGEVISTGNIQDGRCTLTFPQLNEVGTAILTVMGYNKVTEIIEIPVNPAEGPFISVSGYTPNFAPVNVETSLSLSFKNLGVEPTNGTSTVTVSCENEDLVFTDNTASFGVLNADETITLDDAFSYIISEGVEDGAKFTINITIECGTNTWTGKAIVTAGQAILEYVDTSWAGSYEPGTTLTLVASFKNVGHYMATHTKVSASCQNQYVTILNNDIEVGTINPEGFASCVFQVAIDAECPVSTHIPVVFTMQADNGLTTEGIITLKNDCNVIFELHDSYGDGWNGNQLIVSFNDVPQHELTLTSGTSGSYIIEIANGTHVTLSWSPGQYSYECTFTILYENGEQIYQGQGSTDFHYEFDCNCFGSPSIGPDTPPVKNLSAVIDEQPAVRLSWEAHESAISFSVFRNGNKIGQTEDTHFVDETIQGDYITYCVIAEYENGTSLPECIIADITNVEENMDGFTLYPNPATNTLYIIGGDTEYSYEMFNGMGQVMAKGKTQGTEQINVGHMAKGMYFIRLNNGTQVHMEKVAVE